jgi:hypothetical protein
MRKADNRKRRSKKMDEPDSTPERDKASVADQASAPIETDLAAIVRQLDEDRSLAQENRAPAAAVSASLGKAKVLGLIRERHEHSGPNGSPIKHDLSGLSDQELETLEEILSKRAEARGK